MALQKTKDLGNGFSGDYWRINYISGDDLAQIATVRLDLYKDAIIAAAGSTYFIDSVTFKWSGPNYPFTKAALDTGVNVYVAAYTLIKQDPFFSDAVDV